jgi:hypothetical protein
MDVREIEQGWGIKIKKKNVDSSAVAAARELTWRCAQFMVGMT